MEVGYKVFNPDWTCRGFKYEVGKTYEMENKPILCRQGFHYCVKLIDCFNYYRFDNNNKVAKIIAHGTIDGTKEDKHCTNKIEIVEEISWFDVLRMVNTGEGNTGLGNSGNHNSGDCNSGDCNSGDCNSGDFNSGDCNSGNRNSGNHNSGNRNSGNHNSGDCNSGNRNSGNRNSGNHNSGDCNSGNCNSGDCNSGDRCTGVFCTENESFRMFDKPTNWTYEDWRNSKAFGLLYWDLPRLKTVEWIDVSYMSDDEKKDNPNYEVTGGYLKILNTEESNQTWWDSLSKEDKKEVMSLPNFDKDIFKKCTGITIAEYFLTPLIP